METAEKTKHIKNYAKVKARINKYRREELKKARERRDFLKRILNDENNWQPWGDPARNEKACFVPEDFAWWHKGNRVDWKSLENAEEGIKAINRIADNSLKRLEAADKAGKIQEIIINVDWKKNYTWGSNPNAEVWVVFSDAEYGTFSDYAKSGSVGGCNYDKRSAAVQIAFDKLKADKGQAALDRWVIEGGEKLWEEYAFDKSPYPCFNIHSKGMSVFTRLFRSMGCKPYGKYAFNNFVIEENGRSKSSDYYHVIRKDLV